MKGGMIMDEQTLDQVLSTLTSARLAEVIHDLSGRQPADQRDSVTVAAIIDAIRGDVSLDGRAGWGAYLRLREAIETLASDIPGLRYVEGDA